MEVERLRIHQNLESRLRYMEQQDPLVLLVQPDLPAQVEPQVRLVHQAHQEPLELADLQALPELAEPQVHQEYQEQVEPRVLLELQEQADLMVIALSIICFPLGILQLMEKQLQTTILILP